MKVSDYIAQTLAAHGIRHVFLVTGGGAMHLNDAFGRCAGLNYLPMHHEQSCAMAADSYFRLTGRLAAVNVTTGPGATNAITGVYGAYVDSLGMVVVSGQVKRETLACLTKLPLRQLGDQEVDIVPMVSSICKYARLITDPATIRYHLERALHLAVSGRPGPVWLDVPVDVQGAQIEPAALQGYDPAEDRPRFETTDLPSACELLLDRLRRAERPAILAGAGVRISGTRSQFLRLIDALGIPVTTGWNAHDVLWDDHPCYVGRPSSLGDRAGNFAVQNADFLLVLGSRLNVRQVSYNWNWFARAAFQVHVDIDAAELHKPTLRSDLKIHADLRDFFAALFARELPGPTPAHRDYLAWCRERQRKYPVVLPTYRLARGCVNPYHFMEALFDEAAADELVVTGDGTACVTAFQAARLQPDQRLYTNSGSAPMGYDLPGAIGAAVGMGRRVVCLAGDGSVMMNLQELQTIATRRLPIKLFVLNNEGYHSIRQTQQNFFPDNIVGCGRESGLGFPDFAKLAAAFDFPYSRISEPVDLQTTIRAVLDSPTMHLCEVRLDLAQPFAPKVASRRLPDGRIVSSPLEDMSPFLSREELAENLLVPPVGGS
ncbi:MAG: thiamine pyrophosphate-binding protein [Pirellulaceae bacterium]|nr:thiamine pyrophosphate-binding protein [Pirellulaceae bacterium]